MSIFVQLPPENYSGSAFAAFDTNRTGFDLGDARAMMWMSQLSYETDKQSTIDIVGPRWAFTGVMPGKVRVPFMDTRFIVGTRADCTIVAFAGTDPALAANLLTDANVTPSSVNTHSGFQEAANSVWPLVRDLVKNSPRPLYFTGHSLGAALAVLVAFTAHAEGVETKAVYTFGMPRAGLKPFADAYNPIIGERTFRLVHGGDIVPCIPDALVSMPGAPAFLHVGRPLACKSGEKFAQGAALGATSSNDPRFADGVRTNVSNRIGAMLSGKLFGPAAPGVLGAFYAALPFAIRDHLPDRYIHALEP